jgi:membrane protease YdiL (CAAX protease family)
VGYEEIFERRLFTIIKHDRISSALLVLAFSLTIFLATFTTTTIIIFPSILLIGGLTMEMFFSKKHIEVLDDGTEFVTLKTIAYYSLLALVAMILAGYAIANIPLSIPMVPAELTGASALAYTVLIALSEAEFFQGFLLKWLLSVLSQPLYAIFACAGLAAVFHFAVYGTQSNALLYVFIGFFIMNWVTYKSQRMSVPMISHALNNIISVLRVV